MNNLISVIVPIYKIEQYLERCIESIINQSYHNIEIILVNDGSPDKCGEICNKYAIIDNRVKVVHKTNGGLSSARNAGIKAATGEYIGFVDGDDYIDLNMYKVLIESAIMNCSEITAIEYRSVTEKDDKIYTEDLEEINTTFIDRETYVRDLFMHKADTSFCTKLFKSEFIKKYHFSEGILNEDFLLLFEMLKDAKGILKVHKKMYNYVKRQGSITNSGYSKTIIDMVGNASEAYLFSIINYPRLNQFATRFYLYQTMVYLLLIPLKEMNKNNQLYVKSIKEIRRLKKEITVNKYLRNKDKLILFVNCIAPKAFKKILVYLNYKEMYRINN